MNPKGKKFVLLLLVFFLLALSNYLFSKNRKSYSWTLEGDIILCEVHSEGFNNIGIAFKTHYWVTGGYMGIETGILGCKGRGTGFLSLDIGLRLRLIPKGKFSPIIGGGTGLGTCFEWIGLLIRGYFGIEFEIGSEYIITAAYQIGSHGGKQGPSFFAIGIRKSKKK